MVTPWSPPRTNDLRALAPEVPQRGGDRGGIVVVAAVRPGHVAACRGSAAAATARELDAGVEVPVVRARSRSAATASGSRRARATGRWARVVGVRLAVLDPEHGDVRGPRREGSVDHRPVEKRPDGGGGRLQRRHVRSPCLSGSDRSASIVSQSATAARRASRLRSRRPLVQPCARRERGDDRRGDDAAEVAAGVEHGGGRHRVRGAERIVAPQNVPSVTSTQAKPRHRVATAQ